MGDLGVEVDDAAEPSGIAGSTAPEQHWALDEKVQLGEVPATSVTWASGCGRSVCSSAVSVAGARDAFGLAAVGAGRQVEGALEGLAERELACVSGSERDLWQSQIGAAQR